MGGVGRQMCTAATPAYLAVVGRALADEALGLGAQLDLGQPRDNGSGTGREQGSANNRPGLQRTAGAALVSGWLDKHVCGPPHGWDVATMAISRRTP